VRFHVRRKRKKLQKLFLTLSVLYLLALGFAAVASPFLAPYSPTEQFLEKRFLPPLTEGRILGTDDFGRDILSRLIYGSQSVLIVGALSVSIALSAGLLTGLIAGLAGGLIDGFFMLIMDSILSFPTVLLAITVISVFGYGLPQVTIAIGLVFTPVFARLVRAEVLALKTEGFVESARALGTSLIRIVLRHLIPNMTADLIVQSTITFALAVVIESSLSFLGLGTQPPEPSWGLMLKDARNYLLQAPWLAVFPGLTLAATVFSFNFLGDLFSEKLNPRL
jgi:ABC-type dipeptide/oligopeptide/nickel transport system permease subunit